MKDDDLERHEELHKQEIAYSGYLRERQLDQHVRVLTTALEEAQKTIRDLRLTIEFSKEKF